jgi:S-adenosyl-L-methionine hydrolase (adenosine-forming)
MADSIITLTTDFGTGSPFVAAMKGVVLSINPAARLVDLSHDIPPYDLRHAAFFLAGSLRYFPENTLHVVVVDPEVGSDRSVLFVSVAGQRLLVPDNGCWALLAAEARAQPVRVIKVSEPRFFRPTVSATFHGRDIFAPVAAHLSLGVSPADLGPAVTHWRQLAWPAPARQGPQVQGEVIFVDHFGNLITNVPASMLPGFPGGPSRVVLPDGTSPRKARTYADGLKRELVALISSNGLLEVAEVQGNAARRLGAGVGLPVRVESAEEWVPR